MGRPRAINRMQKIYKKLDCEEKEKKTQYNANYSQLDPEEETFE